MRLIFNIVLAFLAANASAKALLPRFVSQHALAEELPSVPGDNPLHYCASPDKDILEIESVDLSPNPPKAGTNLTITATGTFHSDIETGAKVHLTVKYGLITIVRQTADLCDAIEKVNLSCPLKKGTMTLTKDVELPKEIPPGKYTVLADVVTKDDDKITCLTATVVFARSGGKGLLEGLWDN